MGKAQEALEVTDNVLAMIGDNNANLKHKARVILCKGSSLRGLLPWCNLLPIQKELQRYQESISVLEEASKEFPEGRYASGILKELELSSQAHTVS